MKLYSYFRSSTSYRTRIALNLKGLEYDIISVNLKDGAQLKDDFREINPSQGVPVLEDENIRLAQSMAIMEYLEETHPAPSLLPGSPEERAYIRALSHLIASDMHPLNNSRVLKYLVDPLQQSDRQKLEWIHHWLAKGFTAFETMLRESSYSGTCCFENTPTMADACLIPQLYNAKRFDYDLSPYPLINAIDAHCLTLDAFKAAHPEKQPDCDL